MIFLDPGRGPRYRIGAVHAHGTDREDPRRGRRGDGLRGGDWFDAARVRSGIDRARKRLDRRIELDRGRCGSPHDRCRGACRRCEVKALGGGGRGRRVRRAGELTSAPATPAARHSADAEHLCKRTSPNATWSRATSTSTTTPGRGSTSRASRDRLSARGRAWPVRRALRDLEPRRHLCAVRQRDR